MNIKGLHPQSTDISFISVFKGEAGTVTAMQFPTGKTLQKHTSRIPALLVCVSGEVIYQDEKGLKETLLSGDYVKIDPMVEHWIDCVAESNLLLIK